MKKFLIVGLGNIGGEYQNTRHNIGFEVLNAIAHKEDCTFTEKRLGAVTRFRHKGRMLILLKPSTYMNLSGKALKYWLVKEKILVENSLVICDDLNLPFGKLRIKPKGSDGGHNGLKNIAETLNTNQYPRCKFGIGDVFSKGNQVDFVLGKWDEQEQEKLTTYIENTIKAVYSFTFAGIQTSMNLYNK